MENSQTSTTDGFLEDLNDAITAKKDTAVPLHLDDNTFNIVANAIQTAHGPSLVADAWAYQSPQGFNNYNNYDKPKELLLLDGTKILKTVYFGSILRLEERTRVGMHFSWKYPFFSWSKKKYTFLVYNNGNNGVEKFEIDCSLKMFMKIIGQEYTTWASATMSEAVKNGMK